MFVQYFSNQVIEFDIKFREFFYHHFWNNFISLIFHNFMDSVVESVCWSLQFFQQRIQQSQKCINWRKTWNCWITWEIYHCLLNVFVIQIRSCRVIILLFIKIAKLFSYFWAYGISRIVCVFDSIDRIGKNSHKSGDTFPSIINKLSICIGNSRTQHS